MNTNDNGRHAANAALSAFPEVRLDRIDGARMLTINGERQVPLIFAFARTHYVARGTPGFDYANDVVYDQLRRVYEAGSYTVRLPTPEARVDLLTGQGEGRGEIWTEDYPAATTRLWFRGTMAEWGRV